MVHMADTVTCLSGIQDLFLPSFLFWAATNPAPDNGLERSKKPVRAAIFPVFLDSLAAASVSCDPVTANETEETFI